MSENQGANGKSDIIDEAASGRAIVKPMVTIGFDSEGKLRLEASLSSPGEVLHFIEQVKLDMLMSNRIVAELRKVAPVTVMPRIGGGH